MYKTLWKFVSFLLVSSIFQQISTDDETNPLI